MKLGRLVSISSLVVRAPAGRSGRNAVKKMEKDRAKNNEVVGLLNIRVIRCKVTQTIKSCWLCLWIDEVLKADVP